MHLKCDISLQFLQNTENSKCNVRPMSSSARAQPLCGGQPDLAHLLPRYQETIRLPRVQYILVIRSIETSCMASTKNLLG